VDFGTICCGNWWGCEGPFEAGQCCGLQRGKTEDAGNAVAGLETTIMMRKQTLMGCHLCGGVSGA
jgi:hypothetical protein